MIEINRGKSGFTLIELLVVIAIIAVLAAILFPVFMSAKDMAKQASCASNMKQLGTALQTYLQDNRERMPYQASWDDPNDALLPTAAPNWAKSLLKYSKNKGIFFCPSSVPDKNYSPPTKFTKISYMFNGIAIAKSSSLCRHSSKTIVIRENSYSWARAWIRPTFNGAVTVYADGYIKHREGSNFLFVDGHVKARKQSTMSPDPNDPFWNFDDRVYHMQN